ncbi:glycosyltransferase family 2 protein [Microvirga sp. BT689]|uniref:glycosyltransferase family 2 protein n=1 Tax=Microvirga arvi TaxID=2778731 RepID=UPI00194E4675|nr:glycosyltransferase family 2 protein [Microvirga arvi]MBM6582633.1 glycosyltransferase family 2 protein [Microvirga arvi]
MLESKLKLRGLRIGDAVQGLGGDDPNRTGAQLRPEPLCLAFSPTQPLGPGNLFMSIKFPPEGILNVLCRFRLADTTDYYVDLPRVERNHYAGVVSLPAPLTSVTLEVSGSSEPLGLTEIALQPLKGLKKLRFRAGRIVARGLREVRNRIGRKRREEGRRAGGQLRDYQVWMDRFDERPDIDQDLHRRRAHRLLEGPTISLISYVGSNLDCSKQTIASLKAQFYERWEFLVLTDSSASQAEQARLLEKETDSRIAVRQIEGDYASACNLALARAQGTFVGIVPAGAQLPAHALTEIAAIIEAHPNLQLLYTDEDRLDVNQRRHAPLFKPGWSPDFLRSQNYLGDLTLYRTETLRRLGGWRPLESMEDYNIRLRFAEDIALSKGEVVHLPKVLVHVPGTSQTKGGDTTARSPVWFLHEHGEREGPAKLSDRSANRPLNPPLVPEPQPLVSIIIPTRDQAALLHACVRSILDRTDYASYEILIVDNGSQEPETLRLFAEISRNERVRILEYPHPFNYSAINNYAVHHAQGGFLALLNNDVEVIAGGWLSDMAAHASRPEIGCVGAKLLYPDGTVQHGGILLGVAGLAGHAHRNASSSDSGYLGRLQSVLNVSAVTAACLVVRRGIFEEVGGLDEIGLATAFNDVDFCLKVREAGYLNLWTPEAVLVHHESKTRGYEWTKARRARLAREEEVMRRRWGRALLEDPYYSRHLTRVTEDFRIRRV